MLDMKSFSVLKKQAKASQFFCQTLIHRRNGIIYMYKGRVVNVVSSIVVDHFTHIFTYTVQRHHVCFIDFVPLEVKVDRTYVHVHVFFLGCKRNKLQQGMTSLSDWDLFWSSLLTSQNLVYVEWVLVKGREGRPPFSQLLYCKLYVLQINWRHCKGQKLPKLDISKDLTMYIKFVSQVFGQLIIENLENGSLLLIVNKMCVCIVYRFFKGRTSSTVSGEAEKKGPLVSSPFNAAPILTAVLIHFQRWVHVDVGSHLPKLTYCQEEASRPA